MVQVPNTAGSANASLRSMKRVLQPSLLAGMIVLANQWSSQGI